MPITHDAELREMNIPDEIGSKGMDILMVDNSRAAIRTFNIKDTEKGTHPKLAAALNAIQNRILGQLKRHENESHASGAFDKMANSAGVKNILGKRGAIGRGMITLYHMNRNINDIGEEENDSQDLINLGQEGGYRKRRRRRKSKKRKSKKRRKSRKKKSRKRRRTRRRRR